MRSYETTDYPTIDRMVHAWQGRFTAGVSPDAVMLAYLDWLVHLANSPGKQLQLIQDFSDKSMRIASYALQAAVDPDCPPCEEISPLDKRFKGEKWQHWPYNLLHQSFLSAEQWWQTATTSVSGVSAHHQTVVEFGARQLLDIFAPSNFICTNPDVWQRTMERSGLNLITGWQNFIQDRQRAILEKPPIGMEKFKVGENVAITPGKVIFRNRLIELIQYSPTTKSVYGEPVLIVPAWIMKYYILDLSPHNSLVKYLVHKGHTVFMISWKNPETEDRDLGMDDYRTLGAMAAIDAVSAILPAKKIHAVGYCLGGTLLSIAAAAMARTGDERLQSISLLAAQTDFTEAGELMLFIEESTVSYLENIMWSQGYLDTKQMAGAFQLLHSNDLVWSRIIHDYLMGERRPMIDLMAWNADATRMPFKMHSEYLRGLFLNNDLFEGRFEIEGRPIALNDIQTPVFMVTTVNDHVAPWRSVYKFNLLSDAAEVAFLLTSGGHNAGIVSEPDHPRRSYQMSISKEGDKYIDPDTWRETTPVVPGSWWIPWQAWLKERSNRRIAPPPMGAPEKGFDIIEDAPGSYVMQN